MTDPVAPLRARPGFMLRRAHQIAVSVFMEETAAHGITPTQYGILVGLQRHPGLDQITLARLLGLDRSTVSMVLKSLETAGLVDRVIATPDKRRRALALTEAGAALLAALAAPAIRAVERLLAPLDPAERATFLRLLDKLTAALNETARVPLMINPPA